MDIKDIFGAFAYIITGSFIESLLAIGFLIFVYFLFPSSAKQGRFVLYGTTLTITFLLALMLRAGTYAGVSDILKNNNMIFAFFAACTLTLSLVAERLKFARSAIETFADRCVIFLYIYLPLSLLAVMVAVIRNIG